jgi:glycosyltransferase involved in cell wall biosynthesis
MRLIHIFTTTKPYRDVVEMIYRLNSSVGENIILSRDAQPLPLGVSNTRYILAPSGIRGLRFWWWAAQEAKRLILASDSRNDWIISEQVVGIASFILRFVLRIRRPTLVFLVFPSIQFLLKRGWNADRWARPLTLRHKWTYFSDMLRRSMIDIVSGLGADVIAANSDEILCSVNKLSGKRRMALLPNPIDASGGALRQEAARTDFNLLFVAAMQPHKGVALAMEIFSRLLKDIPGARLTLVGAPYPWDTAWFEALLPKYQQRCGDRLVYRGKIPFDELSEVYSEADVFLFPSFYEGSPRVICEAMQCGCAIVTSDLSGNRLIDPDGEALQYFEPGDIDGALRILKSLAADRAALRALKAASQHLIRSRFSSERVAEILLQIYRPMLNGKHDIIPAADLVQNGAVQ